MSVCLSVYRAAEAYQHVHVVQEVHRESSQLQDQLSVVYVRAAVLPCPVMVHVPQVNDVPGE